MRGRWSKRLPSFSDMEREKKIRETAELQARRLQTELRSAQEQTADLERNLHTVQRAKESLETEIGNLAADGDSANSLKITAGLRSRIAELEVQVEDA